MIERSAYSGHIKSTTLVSDLTTILRGSAIEKVGVWFRKYER